MNEKYIQALIVGGLIGAAIIISEFISQSNDDPMKFHAIKLHEDSQVKMADKKIWITDNGETIDLSPDNKEEKRIVIKMNTDDSDNLSINEDISIFKSGQTDHKEKKVVVKVDATIGQKTSLDPILEAAIGSIPFSICLYVFSVTIIASSTIIPNATKKANNETILIV